MENPFLWLVDTIITLYIWILIAAAILSWLIAFNVVNVRNQFVGSVANFFYHVDRAGAAADPRDSSQSRRHRHFAGHPLIIGADVSATVDILAVLSRSRRCGPKGRAEWPTQVQNRAHERADYRRQGDRGGSARRRGR